MCPAPDSSPQQAYSSVQNDYQLLISDRTEIEECKGAAKKVANARPS